MASTLSAFGNAFRLGVSTVELDVQITEDDQAVVTHDRRVDARKCRDTAPVAAGDPEFPYVGKFVHTLSFAQVRTLDCGSVRLADRPGQELAPGSKMPLLREVFALAQRYGAKDVRFNIETKVEAGAPYETAPREKFVQLTAREITAAGVERRVSVQSFDWGALMRLREVAPRLPLVALTNYDFLQTGKPGASPWLGGIDIDDFGGDPIAAVKSFGVTAFSPVHGFPQGGSVVDPGYRPYVTRAMVDHAHRNGIKVVPWTVNDVPTMAKLLDDGVDGLITDYPDRLRGLLASRGYRLPRGYASLFDIQGHRGARSVRPENTLAAFRHALGNPGVSTLELDTGVTADGHVVVIHDRTVNGSHCVDTAPVSAGDPEFPYVGKRIHDLTLAQVKTIDCGSKTLPEFPLRSRPRRASASRRCRRSSTSSGRAGAATSGSTSRRRSARPPTTRRRTTCSPARSSARSAVPASLPARRCSPSTGARSCWPGSLSRACGRSRWCGSTARRSVPRSRMNARFRRPTGIRR